MESHQDDIPQDDVAGLLQSVGLQPGLDVKNATKIKALLLEKFSDVFSKPGEVLQPMKGGEMAIKLKDNAIPYRIGAARQIPVAYRDKAKEALDALVQQDVIQVHHGHAEWTHPLVVVPKKNGKVRVCVDFTNLNKYVVRTDHPLVSPANALTYVDPVARFFSVMDATCGYHQVPLDERSQLHTVFATPWARYRFKRAPMGCLLYTSPSPRDLSTSRMPSSA